MPRDGSGNYTQPFPIVVDGTTIESTVYNGFTNDVSQDLNTPRPIIAGGTGASSADQALFNLGAEKSTQVVTNYDSHVWVPGSFRSAVAADGAPNATAIFSGVCYIHEALANPPTNSNVTVEARDVSTGFNYVRGKVSGVWSAWKKEGSTVVGGNEGIGVTLGDMFFGVAGTAPASFFVVNNESDASGTNLFTISRATGNSSFANTLTAGAYTCGDMSLTYNTLELGSQGVAGPAAIDFHSSGTVSDYNSRILATGAGALGISCLALTLTGSVTTSARLDTGTGFGCRRGSAGVLGGNVFNMHWTGSAMELWADGFNPGVITVTSDYRIKKDVLDLPGMWETVKALRPIKYSQAEFTPPAQIEANREQSEKDADYVAPGPAYVADDIERWGFVAHELQETLLPSAANGEKDSHDTVQSPNWAPLVAALTKALQEAMTRIEALEAG